MKREYVPTQPDDFDNLPTAVYEEYSKEWGLTPEHGYYPDELPEVASEDDDVFVVALECL